MQIYNVELLKLLPVFMREDAFNVSFARYLSSFLQSTAVNLHKLSIWNAIEQLNDSECDMLAWELNIDFYSKQDSISVKRQNLKAGLKSKMNACTRDALQQALQEHSGYSGNIVIKEWFENNSTFNHYSIAIYNPGRYEADKIVKVLDSIGRKSAILDKLEVNFTREATLYTGAYITKSSTKRFEMTEPFNAVWYIYDGTYVTDESGNILMEG